MTCAAPPPVRKLAVGKGGWTFALAFVDPAGNPIDLTAGGFTPVASFFQGNTGATTALTVQLTDPANGRAAALVSEAIVKSTLYPAPDSRLLGGLLSPAATPTFRVYGYLLDALGGRTGEQIIDVQPVDWRSADAGTLPQPPLIYVTVGPAGPPGAPGGKGDKGDPGGVAPYAAQSAGTISDGMAVIMTVSGLLPASCDQSSQAGSVVGLAIGSSVSGQQQTFSDSGLHVNISWNWTPGLTVFVGLLGQLSQSAPTSGYRQEVGVALSATSIKASLSEAEVIE